MKKKDRIVNHQLVFLKTFSSVINNAVTSPGFETLSQINQTENSLKNCQDINLDKDIMESHSIIENNNENNNISNTSINSDYVEASSQLKNTLENFKSQLELFRKEKHDFYLKQKCSKYKNKEKINMVTNDRTRDNWK